MPKIITICVWAENNNADGWEKLMPKHACEIIKCSDGYKIYQPSQELQYFQK
jgi:hypothetical protein